MKKKTEFRVKIPQKTLARYSLAGVQNKLSRTAPNQSEERRMGPANEGRGEWECLGLNIPNMRGQGLLYA
jgi:hypothetical protein